jgi:hypothetical protein
MNPRWVMRSDWLICCSYIIVDAQMLVRRAVVLPFEILLPAYM